jgi:hypothetical protein
MFDPIWESYVMGFSMRFLQEIEMLRSIISFLNMVACARIICVDGVLLTLNIYRVGLDFWFLCWLCIHMIFLL